MKKIHLLFPLLLLSVACIRVNQTPTPEIHIPLDSESDGVFIHVKSGADQPHEVLMALALASKFCDSHDVLMYFDINGISMVTKDAPNLEMEPLGSSDELFKQLVDKGVTILACPGCMKVFGVNPSDLRTGVTVAEKDKFFDFTDGRILTIDY